MQVQITTRSPALSMGIATRLLVLIDRFNQQARQRKALDEERFTQDRLRELRAELNRAEDALTDFRSRNRIREAPELQREEERLDRDVTMRQQVFTNIAQLYEQVRLDAVRDVPVITVVEPPATPAHISKPVRRTK